MSDPYPKRAQKMADDLRETAGGALFRVGRSIGGSVTLDAATAHAVGDLLERLVQCWDEIPQYVQAGAGQAAICYEGRPSHLPEEWQEGDVVRSANDPTDTRAWSLGNGRWWPIGQASVADDPTWRPGHFLEDLPLHLTLIVRNGHPANAEVSR